MKLLIFSLLVIASDADLVKNTIKGIETLGHNVEDTLKLEKNNTKNVIEMLEPLPEKCYHDFDLGCFPNSYPWRSPLRPFPSPNHPSDVGVQLYLYTNTVPHLRYYVYLHGQNNKILMEKTDFKPERPYNVFMTHGYLENGNVTWLDELKKAYLYRRDANVFIVDWGKGSLRANYFQAASNTRIAGAEIARFIKFLMESYGIKAETIHLMGHSLGSHVMAMAAKVIPNIGHLTAFDPAQPGFEMTDPSVRIQKEDAVFVEAIHTSGRPFIPNMGFGMFIPVGHVDYYMNGGLWQPGCAVPPLNEVPFKHLSDLTIFPAEMFGRWVACSHCKSFQYYIEALTNEDCIFWGFDDGTFNKLIQAGTAGEISVVLKKFENCNLDKCIPFGLDSMYWPARGTFIVITNVLTPYCSDEPAITSKMYAEMREYAKEGGANSKKKILGPLVDKLNKLVG